MQSSTTTQHEGFCILLVCKGGRGEDAIGGAGSVHFTANGGVRNEERSALARGIEGDRLHRESRAAHRAGRQPGLSLSHLACQIAPQFTSITMKVYTRNFPELTAEGTPQSGQWRSITAEWKRHKASSTVGWNGCSHGWKEGERARLAACTRRRADPRAAVAPGNGNCNRETFSKTRCLFPDCEQMSIEREGTFFVSPAH